MVPTLGAIDWVNGLLVVLLLFVSILMILIVLIQRPQGGGLSGAFGSASGSGQTAFGARTGDALTIATIVIFLAFLVTAMGLNYTVRPAKVKPGAVMTAPAGDAPPPVGTEPPRAPIGAEAGKDLTPPPTAPLPIPMPGGEGQQQPSQPEPAPANPEPQPEQTP